MRTFLSVLLSYVFLCIAGVACTSALFMVYTGCMHYVVGQPLELFSLANFYSGIIISVPLVVIFIPMFLFLSLIRHSRKNRIIGTITTVVLTLASWLVVLPFLYSHVNPRSALKNFERHNLSSGYFRFSDKSLFYFTNVDKEGHVDGVEINVAKDSTAENSFRLYESEKFAGFNSDYFSDILVRDSIEIPELIKLSLIDLYSLSVAAKKSLQRSYISWAFFCSFALALIFVFMLSDISKWRLINAFIIVLTTGLIIKVNAICYGFQAYAPYLNFIETVNDKVKAMGSFFNAIESPFCVCVNIVCVLIFVIFGIVFGVKNRKAANSEEGAE